ncbi:hypothetical protein OAU50_08090 [Planctomycetota bacterium]|nr:hypothetical protein [Planctomycetota bacterium]
MKIALAMLALFTPLLTAGEPEYTDPATHLKEFGKVHWLRNMDTAVELAKANGKCIYLQFQEVPG